MFFLRMPGRTAFMCKTDRLIGRAGSESPGAFSVSGIGNEESDPCSHRRGKRFLHSRKPFGQGKKTRGERKEEQICRKTRTGKILVRRFRVLQEPDREITDTVVVLRLSRSPRTRRKAPYIFYNRDPPEATRQAVLPVCQAKTVRLRTCTGSVAGRRQNPSRQ